jgi:hypothetical protein
MTNTTAIAEDRPLTAEEALLVRWLLEHGVAQASQFLPQLSQTRVVSHCYCGCASIDFAVAGVVPPLGQPMQILADYHWQTAEGHLFGVFVFARAGLLAGLEVWSVDGLAAARALPTVGQLRPLSFGQPA